MLDIPITDEEFDYIRDLVRIHSAMVIDSGKKYLVETRLSPMAAHMGCETLGAFIGRLRSTDTSPIHREVVEAMAICETSFFRDPDLFDAIRDIVIPDLVKRRQPGRELKIWSAACATGQEPYSLAMLFRENFKVLDDWNVRVFATDFSRDMLSRAVAGKFTQTEVNRGLPAYFLIRYFQKEGIDWRIAPQIRSAVTFSELNLAEEWPALPQFDLILMRNVMIYFDLDLRKKILGRLHRLLAPDGYLVLGGAETTINLDSRFEPVRAGTSCGYFRPVATNGEIHGTV